MGVLREKNQVYTWSKKIVVYSNFKLKKGLKAPCRCKFHFFHSIPAGASLYISSDATCADRSKGHQL